MAGKTEFLDFVQQHERVWGSVKYKNRPTLNEIMQSPVVALWLATGEEPKKLIYTMSAHKNLNEIRNKLIEMVFYTESNFVEYRLFRLYHHQERVKIKEIKIVFTKE